MFKRSLYLTLVLFGAQVSAASSEVSAPTEEAGNVRLITLQQGVANLSAEQLETRYSEVKAQHDQSVIDLTNVLLQAREQKIPAFQHADYQTCTQKANALALEKRVVGEALEKQNS